MWVNRSLLICWDYWHAEARGSHEPKEFSDGKAWVGCNCSGVMSLTWVKWMATKTRDPLHVMRLREVWHLVFRGKYWNKLAHIEIDFVGSYFGLPSLETHVAHHLVTEWDCIPEESHGKDSEMTWDLRQIKITVFLPLSTIPLPSLPTLHVDLRMICVFFGGSGKEGINDMGGPPLPRMGKSRNPGAGYGTRTSTPGCRVGDARTLKGKVLLVPKVGPIL